MTGSSGVHAAMKHFANDYLLKDEDIEDAVVIAIDSVMETHRLKAENARLLEELVRRNQELERLSLLDGLTGIPNRCYFDNVIALYGGEGFVAVLPGTPLAGALFLAEAMRREVAAPAIPHEASSVCDQITISLVTSTIPEGPRLTPRWSAGPTRRSTQRNARAATESRVRESLDGSGRGDGEQRTGRNEKERHDPPGDRTAAGAAASHRRRG